MGTVLIILIIGYFAAVNIAAFIAYGHDKKMAEKDMRRTPEKILLLFACAGGPVGALVGMKVFRHKTRKMKFRILVPAALVIWILLWLFIAVQILPTLEGEHIVSHRQSASTWMKALPDDKLISDVVLPGVHDAVTDQVQLAFFSCCQSESISSLLKDGYRYLDVRIGTKETKKGTTLYIVHGFTYCLNGFSKYSFGRLMKVCTKFLKKNPSESIVFVVKYEHGDETIKTFQKLLDEELEEYKGYVLFTDTMPTVSEARGKIVLFRRYEDEADLGVRAGLPLLWEDQAGHDDVSLAEASTDNGSYTVTVQDRYCYNVKDKWTAFTGTAGRCSVKEGSGDVLINFLSTKGTFAYGHPYYFANILNRNLETWLRDEGGQPEGWIITDFGNADQAKLIYTLNE